VSEIEWIGENGFDFVDIFMEPPRAEPDMIDPEAVCDALRRYGLDAVGHLAWYLPIGSPLSRVRQAAVAVAEDCLKVFEKLPVNAVTVHANWPPRFFSPYNGIEWQLESLRAVIDVAKNLGLAVMYEPLDGPLDTPENIERVLNELPQLVCHLDLGHCNLWGRKPADMLRRFAARLGHIHLHDNDGRSDLHLPPGAGNIDWHQVMRVIGEIGYDKTITIEVFCADRLYVLQAKEKIEALCSAARK